MIMIEDGAVPTDSQLPDFDAVTLRRLSDQIIAAAAVPKAARLRARSVSVRRFALIVAAVAASVVVIAAIMPSPPAQAWSPTPSLAQGSVRADLAAACQRWMGTDSAPVLIEQRGTSNLTVLADSSECLNAQGLGGIGGTLTSGGQGTVPDGAPGADEVQVISANALSGIGGAPDATGHVDMVAGYMGVIGRAGSNVLSIVVHAPGQPDITASMENGWFAAWWPSLERPSTLTVTTAVGNYSVRL
jgi:hypothetical protein